MQKRIEDLCGNETEQKPLTRREVLKAGLTGLALASGCAGLQLPWDTGLDFHANPYTPIRKTFYQVVGPGGFGGAGIEIFGDGTAVACAPGEVVSTRGHPRGVGVTVAIHHKPFFGTYYTHLLRPSVSPMQEVKRGQAVGTGFQDGYLKLLFLVQSNWTNADDFGAKQGYMNFWDYKTDLEVTDPYEKYWKQHDVIESLIEKCKVPGIGTFIITRTHSAMRTDGFARWSHVERFKYLQHLYKKNPENFNASKEEIDNLIKTFYDNQSIVLTLPIGI